jgi:twinkle protein
MDKHL